MMSLYFSERQVVTVTKTARRSAIALVGMFTTIGVAGIGVNITHAILALKSNHLEAIGVIPATSLLFAGSLAFGVRQFKNRNKPVDVQLPNLTHAKFLESVSGQALMEVGILPSATNGEEPQRNLSIVLAPIDPRNLKVEDREVLKEFVRITQPIVNDMELPHLSPEMRQQQVDSIRFHATEAAKRLRGYQEIQRAQQDGKAWGSIAGSGYMPDA